MSEDAAAEVRHQLLEAFSGVEYPVESATELVPALPNGLTTTFEADDVRVTAMELGTKLSAHQDFPYDDAETLVDDIIAGMRAEGML